MSNGESASERYWESHYTSGRPPTGIPDPNGAFVGVIDDHAPTPHEGRALELGSGRGGDALWLAARGWNVTATDASTSATARLNDLARRIDTLGSVDAITMDLSSGIPDGHFDLVFACYFQSPVDIDRDEIVHRAGQRVRLGGLLVVIDHASSAPWSWSRDLAYPTADQTLVSVGLDHGWRPLMVAPRERIAISPADGRTRAAVVDNIIVLRRENGADT